MARELLESLSMEHPEIYNAGRLVNLIDRTTTPNSTQNKQIISREDVERIVRQLNPVTLPIPRAVTAVPGVNSISLTWSPSTGATAYVVQRLGATDVNVVTETNYVDSGLSPNVQYCYSVVASNKLGSSLPSPKTCATLSPKPPVQPADQPAAPPDEPLWKQYWYVIAGVIIVGGYFLFRSPR